MSDHSQHYHRCRNQECDVTWICQHVNCGTEEFCDACERRHFEAYHEARGFTTSQPELEMEKES